MVLYVNLLIILTTHRVWKCILYLEPQ